MRRTAQSETRQQAGVQCLRVQRRTKSTRVIFPDYVLPSRFVDRWKPQDDGGVSAKARLVILGFKDPHVLQLERSAPTPTNEGFT